ncbi:MAG: ABC transporter permease subunit, partial [Gammaproteobacteria bacterium]
MTIDWLFLFEISLAGLGTGGLYALTGLSFVLIYKATRVVNLAIGEMLMVGAYAFFAFAVALALPVWLAIVSAIVVGGLLGALVERTMIRPMLGESPISVLMVTIGLASVLVGLVELVATATPRQLPEFMPQAPIMIGEA